MSRRLTLAAGAALLCLLGWLVPVLAQAPRDARHGGLLYDTYCGACHTAQIHWRERKLATDWSSLLEQVNRWQFNNGLGWTGADVADVAQYLNNRYYGYSTPD
jgi:mono/diheme cytochrome c family protein